MAAIFVGKLGNEVGGKCLSRAGIVPARNGVLAARSEAVYNPAASAVNGNFDRIRCMAVERTLSIVKPDATRRNLVGQVVAKLEESGLRIVAMKRLRLTRDQAERFYEVHNERSFFSDLCEFMTSGPVVVQVLEGEGAIAKNREVMGATNPANADDGTIRKEFGESVEANTVHGSDSDETAAREIVFFFGETEILP